MTIKDGIYGYVSGTVGRIFQTKNGSAFVLEVAREGSQYPDRVTIWGAADNVSEGDRVSVKGWISWRREVKDEKTYFNVSVNKPEVVEREAGTPPEPVSTPGWPASTPGGGFDAQTGAQGFGYDSAETPF